MFRFTGLPQFSTKRRVWHMLSPKMRLKKIWISLQNIFRVCQYSYSLSQMPQVWTDPLCSNSVWHHRGARDHRALQVIWLWTSAAPLFHVTSEDVPTTDTTATARRLKLLDQVSLGPGPWLVPRVLGATSEECKRPSQLAGGSSEGEKNWNTEVFLPRSNDCCNFREELPLPGSLEEEESLDKVTKMNTTIIIIKDKMNNLLLDFPSWFSHGEYH